MSEKNIPLVNEDDIERGDRGSAFKTVIKNALQRGNIKEKYLDILLTEDSLKVYNTAFTHKSANPKENYEILEHLGDVTANNILAWYFYRKFPQLNCPNGLSILSKLESKYKAKKSYSTFANNLGFWDFVSADKKSKATNRNTILEDVFESFIGASELLLDTYFMIGVGNNILYDVMKSLLDEENISLKFEDISTSRTRIKEFIDKLNSLNKLNKLGRESKYRYETLEDIQKKDNKIIRKFTLTLFMTLFYIDENGKTIIIEDKPLGKGTAFKKADAEEEAAKNGLNYILNVLKIPELRTEINDDLHLQCQF